MGHPTLALLLLLVLSAPGCANVRWTLQKSLRAPGERIESFPEQVWRQYRCERRRRPFFAIEQNELVPPKVRPGGAFNHRLVYALCPPNPTEVVAGRLETRIRFRGAPIVLMHDAYELKPGRWVVDAEVSLPGNAKPGVYSFELAFHSSSVTFDERLTFVVSD